MNKNFVIRNSKFVILNSMEQSDSLSLREIPCFDFAQYKSGIREYKPVQLSGKLIQCFMNCQ